MSEFLAVTVLGAIVGTTYGLLAVGLVIVHRSSKVVNFAHGDIGIFAGTMFGVFVIEGSIPYYLAIPVAIALGVAASVVTELAVMRRLKDAPIITKIVATIGVAAFLQVFTLVLGGDAVRQAGRSFPRPPGLPEFGIGPLFVTSDYTAMLFFSPVVVVALAVFLQRSRFGTAVRASAANADAARLAGISAARMSMLSWAIAGGLSAYTAVLLIPSRASSGAASVIGFGPGLLMRGLAAAVLARMTSLPIALGAGVGIGIVEQHALYNQPSLGRVDALLLVLILVALLVQRRPTSGRHEDGSGWLAVELVPVRPEHRRLVSTVGWATACAALALGVLLPSVVSSSTTVILTLILTFTVLGLGLGIVSGLAGQLSLGQFGIAGMGAAASYVVVDRTDNFALALPAAILAGAAVAVVLGLPAVRIRGLMFAVVTMSFALAVPWILEQHWLFARPQDPGRPVVNGMPLDSAKRYYYFVLVFVALAFLLARNVWGGALGRRFRAVRDNEAAAKAFAISATRVKLLAFALGGGLAGLAGALYAHSLSALSSASFTVQGSLTAAALVAVGGVGSLVGPLLGSLYIIGIPRFLPLDNAGLAATSLGWLLLILQFPGGLAQAFVRQRDRVLERLAPVADDVVDAATPKVVVGSFAPRQVRQDRPAEGSELLQLREVRRRFGGVVAVDDVSFDVRAGEILGLIGPNGAGKTTLFEVISGFTRADHGSIVFQGSDVTDASPEARTRLGLVRSFQDAALFPTLTVLETVQLSLERATPTNLLAELAGVQRSDAKRRARARELISTLGLESYASKRIADLSTGTRRITELACLVALEPVLLLLDEPTSGIAQRESEALGDVLRRMRTELDVTMIVVEHDIPLIMSLSDRIVAMATGGVITIGSPAAVREHPEVVASYLGDSDVAITRSGASAEVAASTARDRCHAITRSGATCTRRAVHDGRCSQHALLQAVGT
jgi:ABC-type branched-subunit amino acid transport system ATPase component/ABC-type branched-subunit amino acid transport system permease subunit